MNFDHDREVLSVFDPGTCLSELDASSLTAISAAAVRHSFEKGQIVCMEGEPCLGLIIIEAGWLTSVKISPQGREQEIGLAGPGEMINEISVMSGDINLITLKSLEHSIVWVIEQGKLFDLMAKHPILSNVITKNLAKRVVHLLNLVEDLALRNVEGRLARLLLNRSKNGIVQRQNWSTQAEMASCIGTTPVIISRILGEMEDKGAIHLEHHQIRILNHNLLETSVLMQYK